jgi:glycosyltransferase involved in cell wall biosynthesis
MEETPNPWRISAVSKIVIFGSLAESLLNFRGDLIRHLRACGHEVVAVAPGESAEVDLTLKSWGVRRVQIRMDRTGIDPISDLRFLIDLCRLLQKEQPDVLLAYTIKPVVYGMLAARFAGVSRRVAMITGLGFAFNPTAGLRQKLARMAARALYRAAMACANVVVFQNPDDELDFRNLRMLGNGLRVLRTAGSGVNLERFTAQRLPDGPLRFLMIARLLKEKGVREYMKAAALVRQTRPELEFHLVGPFDTHPSAASRREVEASVAAGHIVYHGAVADVRTHLAHCHVFVLPSYREGTPRSVLEAMAVGRPIVTTDAPGCRETVIPGENGLLVPPGQSEALGEAMQSLAKRSSADLERMALSSRHLATTRYDVRIVNAQIADALGP